MFEIYVQDKIGFQVHDMTWQHKPFAPEEGAEVKMRYQITYFQK